MDERFVLGTIDCIIFGTMLVISGSIGLFFRIFGGEHKSNDDYLLAGKNMSVFPVAFSLMATFMSATTLMGVPAEIYLFGTQIVIMNTGFIIGPLISSFAFLPVYFETQVSTPYEYLEKRFGRSTQRMLSIIFLIQMALYNAVVLYAPALALSAVTNISITSSVISVGVVCTFYCTIGGMKAILWTDVFQAIIMFICLFAIITVGCIEVGGLENIFELAYDGGRMILPTFNLDFSTRYTFYNVFLQSFILTTFAYCGSQTQVQRSLTTKNLKKSIIANMISAPMLSVFHLLCCACGIICYAHFKNCDPLSSPLKPVNSADQLMPYFIVETMGKYPGLPGLCIAGIFSASLSSMSSAINSMAAVTYEDVIKPIWPHLQRSVLTTKLASLSYGVLTVFMSFLVATMGNLVKATLLVLGLVAGPALGVFVLAVFSTVTTEMGANLGVMSGFVLGFLLIFIPNTRYYPNLPFKTNCSSIHDNANVTVNQEGFIFTNTKASENVTLTLESKIDNFPVSFMWLSSLSLLTCLVVGYSFSWIQTCLRGKSLDVPAELLSPLRRRFLKENLEIENIELKNGNRKR